MKSCKLNRRDFIEVLGAAAPAIGLSPGTAQSAQDSVATVPLEIDPTLRFALSPYLYMQFMEPLGGKGIP